MRLLVKLDFILATQFGLDLKKMFGSLLRLPKYLIDYYYFRSKYQGQMRFLPCLHDRHQEGGTTKSEYFWQDLLVARWIHAASPNRHVDIGSRVDGFVAHIASFRKIEVFDVRPVTTQIPGIVFTKVDMMNGASIAPLLTEEGYCDSLSCLHALEHFGLGRYGDPIEPYGYKKGLANLASLLRPDGTLYLSLPIGIERVEFNANWVFDPRTIITTALECGLSPKGLTIVSSEKDPQELSIDETTLQALANKPYHLGIFTFKKNPHALQ